MIQARLLRFASASMVALGIALAGSPAQAQTVEAEPNSSCVSAQNLTSNLPMTVAASLDTPPVTPDVAIGRRSLFCISKVGQTFQQMPDKERRELLKRAGDK